MASRPNKMSGALTARANRSRKLRRALVGLPLALAVLAGAGAGYERIAGLGDAKRFPVPGQLVDVGGHRLQIFCIGEGSPTVVLDAGLGGTSLDWEPIQGRLSAQTRVCAYDRAGMGWSDAGPMPRSPTRIAGELHSLLSAAGVPGPYVLVAHSLSGKGARLFASAHPGDIAGLVLVDTRSERIDAATSGAATEAFSKALTRQAVLLSLARRFGLVRLFGPILAEKSGLPSGAAGEMLLMQSQPQSLEATTSEGLARSADDEALMGSTLGSIPLVVIAAEDSNLGIPGWAEAQADLAALSTRGRLIVARGSSHMVAFDQPEVVIEAFLSLLDLGPAGN